MAKKDTRGENMRDQLEEMKEVISIFLKDSDRIPI